MTLFSNTQKQLPTQELHARINLQVQDLHSLNKSLNTCIWKSVWPKKVEESSLLIFMWDDEWPDVGDRIRQELNLSFHTY